MAHDIEQCLKWYPINPGLSSAVVMRHLLMRLQKVLLGDVPGDVVEMGCHAGGTSVFFARMLAETSPSRTLYLYDSFKGLPARHPKDNQNYGTPGSVHTAMETVIRRFEKERLPMPRIHHGWFRDLQPIDIPDKVAFGFFDGDMYESILDSFRLIYPRMEPGAVVCVHDYAVDNWPGVKSACDDFLADKPERMTNPVFLLGVLIKQ